MVIIIDPLTQFYERTTKTVSSNFILPGSKPYNWRRSLSLPPLYVPTQSIKNKHERNRVSEDSTRYISIRHLPWRRLQRYPKRTYISNRSHGITSQKTEIFLTN